MSHKGDNNAFDSDDNEELNEHNTNAVDDPDMNTLKLRKNEVKILISNINQNCEQWPTGVAKAQVELLKTAWDESAMLSIM